jgi:hypothetical protein
VTNHAAAKTPSARERFLDSPRAQRRALLVGFVIFLLGGGFFLFKYFGNTGHPLPNKISDQPASVVSKEPTVALDPSIVPLVKKFISTAVLRKNLGEAYAIVGPDIRGGLTKKQFESGNIPVIPYPVADIAHLEYTVDYSHARQAGLEVGLNPTANAVATRRLTFFAGVRKIGTGPAAHWVVNYWSPRYHPPIPKTQ